MLLTDINELRSDDEIIRRVDAFLGNLNELRAAANGGERVIKWLMPQFINFRGRDGCLCRQFPDGVTLSDKARNAVMQVPLLLYLAWAVRMDALMAIDDMLGTEFDSNAVYTDSIPEDEFKDVYNAVERALLQQIFLGRA